MKSPAAGMNVSSVPAMMPGAESGRVTRRKDCDDDCVEILGRFEQARVHLLERDVDRQRHEGQEVVGDPGEHRERRRQQPAVGREDVDVAQDPDDRPLVGKDVEPRERPHEIGDEERRDDDEQEEVPPRPGAEGDPVDERVREDEACDRRDPRVDERANELLSIPAVGVRAQCVHEIRELPAEMEVRKDPGLQRLIAEKPHRHQKEDREPEHPWREQQVGREAPMAVEERSHRRNLVLFGATAPALRATSCCSRGSGTSSDRSGASGRASLRPGR